MVKLKSSKDDGFSFVSQKSLFFMHFKILLFVNFFANVVSITQSTANVSQYS